MTVPAQSPVSNHVGNGVTTTFAYAFKLLDEADIRVSVDGILKTLNVDYTVTGVDVDAGGTIVFAVAPANLAAIALTRLVVIQRLTDYQYSGDFQSPTVNRDFDRIVMMLQDSGLALANTLRFPPGDPANGVIPAVALRALKGLAFDVDGNPIATAASDASALAAQLASSASDSVGGALVGYDQARAYGAGTVGKGIKDAASDAADAAADAADAAADAATAAAAAAAADTNVNTYKADVASQIDAAKGAALMGFKLSGAGSSGRTLSAKLTDEVSVKDFGAVGNGIADDTAAITAALAFAVANDQAIYFPKGTYLVASKITVTGNVVMRGAGRSSTKLVWMSVATTAGIEINLPLDGVSLSKLCDVSGMTFSTQRAGFDTALKIIGATATAADRIMPRVVVRDVVMRGDSGPLNTGWLYGLYLTNCSNSVVDSFSFIGKVNASEPNYTSENGITYDNANGASPHPAAVAITNANILYAKFGIYMEDFEGALVSDSQIVGVNSGVRFGGPNTFPHASLMNCHVNASNACMLIDRMYEVVIQGNLLYNELGANTGVAINIVNAAAYFSIVGNIIENLKPNHAMDAITVTSGSKGLISDNIFRRCNSGSGAVNGTAIWLTAGSSQCTVRTNVIDATTTPVLDQGSINNVEYAGSSGTLGWATDAMGFTHQWGSQAVTLNGSGDVVITLPKTYRSAHHTVLVNNGNDGFSPTNVFVAQVLSTSQFACKVRPSPGAVPVQVNWMSRGI